MSMMEHEPNPFIRRQNLMQEARRNYVEREWRLTFLRTISSEAMPKLTDDQILEWHTQNTQRRLN